MDACVFCKIVSGEFGSAKVWEDGEFLAILDVNPNMKGMALVLTKQHYPSYSYELPADVQSRFYAASGKVARLLEKGLGVKRVALVMEGMGINHAHLKLYPLHGLEQGFQEMWAKERVFFERYEGYLSTQLGPKMALAELEALAREIRARAGPG
jgi:diadenosine tetraphosphate (Ap4A) HIT family hydrolase